MDIRELIENAERSLVEGRAMGIVTDSSGRPTGTALWYMPRNLMVVSLPSENDPPFFFVSPEQIRYSLDGEEWTDATGEEFEPYKFLRFLDPRFALARSELELANDEWDGGEVSVDGFMDVSDLLEGVPSEFISRIAEEGSSRRQVHFVFAGAGLVSFRQRDFDPSGQEDVNVRLAPFPASDPTS